MGVIIMVSHLSIMLKSSGGNAINWMDVLHLRLFLSVRALMGLTTFVSVKIQVTGFGKESALDEAHATGY